MVWATLILVYTSTVVAAVPIEPPVAKSVLTNVVLTVAPLLVNTPTPAPLPTVKLPLIAALLVTVSVPAAKTSPAVLTENLVVLPPVLATIRLPVALVLF